MKSLICEKCGAELIPGKNWYTMKQDKICCNYSSWPYYVPTNRAEEKCDFDCEEAILFQQDSYYDD